MKQLNAAGTLVMKDTAPGAPGSVRAGLFLVSPAGKVQQIISLNWTVLAFSTSGGAFATPAGRRTPVSIVVGSQSRVVSPSAVALAAQWSASGKSLACVLDHGDQRQELTVTSGGVRKRKPILIEGGYFGWRDSLVWATKQTTMAYAVASDAQSQPSLKLYTRDRVSTIATLEPSDLGPRYRTFDWSRQIDELAFIKSAELYVHSGGVARKIAPRESFAQVDAVLRSQGRVPAIRAVRFSPDGRHIAVSFAGATAVFTRDGSAVAAFSGTFNGWAGNENVLTLPVLETVPSLVLNPLDQAKAATVIERAFKNPVAADVQGGWFAYSLDSVHSGSRAVRFRTRAGDLLRIVRLKLQPVVVGSITKTGAISPAASAY